MKYEYDDGGREVAGFKGKTRDCVTRAIAIAMQRPYASVYKDLNERCRGQMRWYGQPKSSARLGVPKDITKSYLAQHGWTWHPTMEIGSGCKVHLRDGELPMGRLIVSVSRHLVAVIDGVIHDIFDCSRGGNRCVYGYWTHPASKSTPQG